MSRPVWCFGAVTVIALAGCTVNASTANRAPTSGNVDGFDGAVGSDPSPESIIGADQRTSVSTTSYPARAVGLITRDGSQWCTGWLISKDTVLTAGHCVVSGGKDRFPSVWFSGLRFWPGRNGTSAPYGSCVPRSGGLFSFVAWVRDGDTSYDAGIIKLSCSVGTRTGWFGLWWQAADLTGQPARVNGYPGDRPETQWTSTDFVRATTVSQILYRNDTFGGMSGSPVWQNRPAGSVSCSGVCGMGIHTSGGEDVNYGTRVTEDKFNVYASISTAP